MSTLKAFLNPTETSETKDVIVSQRFKDDEGNLQPFTIRTITQTENEHIIKACTRQVTSRTGPPTEKLDRTLYQNTLIVACTVSPDFSQTDLLTSLGVLSPTEGPGKMLIAGEFAKLVNEIMELNHFNDDDASEQAKN